MRTPLARGRELAASPVLCEEKPDPDDTWLDWYYLATDTAALAAAGPLAEPQFVLESIIVPYRPEASPSGH